MLITNSFINEIAVASGAGMYINGNFELSWEPSVEESSFFDNLY